ncbi:MULTISPECIES: phosphoribosyltransferase [Hyphobacterium]|uniref:Phosphoribosyltransferase n=1 Tax=Hyphobacterium vulgare TaxID=1736751 RepID=A0ABV6ZX87_9PROT
MRKFKKKRILQLTDESFTVACTLLATSITRHGQDSFVLSIARGGYKLGDQLSRLLNLPHYKITASHNASDAPYSKTNNEVKISTSGDVNLPESGTAVLVDDICGTGKTMIEVKSYIQRTSGIVITQTATLCRNIGSDVLPTHWVWDVDDWVLFPWEDAPRQVDMEPLPSPKQVYNSLGG